MLMMIRDRIDNIGRILSLYRPLKEVCLLRTLTVRWLAAPSFRLFFL